jgi:DNA-binding HxlR family transcriptional regulator
LHAELDGISQQVLADALRRAERDGLISRHLDPSKVQTATHDDFTGLGRSHEKPLAAFSHWVQSN